MFNSLRSTEKTKKEKEKENRTSVLIMKPFEL